MNDYTKCIRLLNDAHRLSVPFSKTVLTQGVASLPSDDLVELFMRVRDFKEFGEDNDPYGEHDFGRIVYKGEPFYFKIDYYAKDDFTRGSEDPADSRVTTRILTILKAEEY